VTETSILQDQQYMFGVIKFCSRLRKCYWWRRRTSWQWSQQSAASIFCHKLVDWL